MWGVYYISPIRFNNSESGSVEYDEKKKFFFVFV